MTRRAAVLRLGPIAAGGALAAHAVAYGLVHGDPSASHAPGHGYLPAAAAVVAPVAVTALVVVAAAAVRDARGRSIRVAPLLGLQALLFVAQEVAEHALTGNLSAMGAAPVVWTGLAAQVAIAVLVVAGIRRVGRAVSLLRLVARGRVTPLAGAVPAARREPGRPGAVRLVTPVGLRAPPALRSP